MSQEKAGKGEMMGTEREVKQRRGCLCASEKRKRERERED